MYYFIAGHALFYCYNETENASSETLSLKANNLFTRSTMYVLWQEKRKILSKRNLISQIQHAHIPMAWLGWNAFTKSMCQSCAIPWLRTNDSAKCVCNLASFMCHVPAWQAANGQWKLTGDPLLLRWRHHISFLLHRLDRDFFRQYFEKCFFPVCALITNIWENVGIFVSDTARIYSRIWMYLWALDHKLDLTALSRDALFGHGGSFYSGSFTRCGVRWSRVEKGNSRKRTKLISTIVKEWNAWQK